MNAPMQNGPNRNDALRERKLHLAKLLYLVDSRSGKVTNVQTMTINLIKAEMDLIDSQIQKRP
jgi:hypothetical protein